MSAEKPMRPLTPFTSPGSGSRYPKAGLKHWLASDALSAEAQAFFITIPRSRSRAMRLGPCCTISS